MDKCSTKEDQKLTVAIGFEPSVCHQVIYCRSLWDEDLCILNKLTQCDSQSWLFQVCLLNIVGISVAPALEPR